LELISGDPKIETKYTARSGILLVVDNQTKTQLTQLRILNGTFLPAGFHKFVFIKII
jgi:hypothetical protein